MENSGITRIIRLLANICKKWRYCEKTARRDALAAALILQGLLDSSSATETKLTALWYDEDGDALTHDND